MANARRTSAATRPATALNLTFWGSRLPTSRDVARTVAARGTGALTEAERRADSARYQEVRCRSALNRVEGMPFKWTVNPYRGCTHGCHYCFARRYHAQFEMDAHDHFSSIILVKQNIGQVLAREVDRRSWRRELVALGTATDAYQPIEGHYRLTRAALIVLARAHTPVHIVTKGPMVVRDIDVLREAVARAGCTVCMSVPTVDEAAWQALEPGTAHPLQRLRAVKALAEAGVPVGVLMAPIVPGFTASRSQFERTIAASAAFGARFIGYNVMHLHPGTRDHFMAFVERHFPAKLPRLQELYTTPYAPAEYRRRVESYVGLVQRRYGLASRPFEHGPAQTRPGGPSMQAEQVAFRWEDGS